MPSSARKHKPLRPPGQRVAKRNAPKKRLIKYSFAPRPKAHPRRGNPRSSLYRTPPRPSGSHRRPAGTISRRPPSARRATAPERVQVPFSLDRARPVSLLARQKRNGGCIPAGQAPCGSRNPSWPPDGGPNLPRKRFCAAEKVSPAGRCAPADNLWSRQSNPPA